MHRLISVNTGVGHLCFGIFELSVSYLSKIYLWYNLFIKRTTLFRMALFSALRIAASHALRWDVITPNVVIFLFLLVNGVKFGNINVLRCGVFIILRLNCWIIDVYWADFVQNIVRLLAAVINRCAFIFFINRFLLTLWVSFLWLCLLVRPI